MRTLLLFYLAIGLAIVLAQNLGGYTYSDMNTFNYQDNGRNWGNQNWQCQTGQQQSPIDIDNTTSIALQRNFILNIQKVATVGNIEMFNNGHSIQANYPWMEFQATNVQGQVKQYKATELHFHAPSEHSFNGNLRDLELHIVCDQVSGPTSVIFYNNLFILLLKNGLTKGIFVILFQYSQLYTDNPLIEPFSQAAAGYAPFNAAHTEKINANLYNNLKKELQKFGGSLNPLTYFTYQGSLTTPPCTEIAEWYILKQALPISFKQLWNFQQLWAYNFNFAQGNGNNRITQKPNGRTVVEGIITANIEVFGSLLRFGLLAVLFILLLL